MDRRIREHPVLGPLGEGRTVEIVVDGRTIGAVEGEPIAAALLAVGIRAFRYTRKREAARGLFCAIGRCTDCAMTVDGVPNVRTCITPVAPGMRIETQKGLGQWCEGT